MANLVEVRTSRMHLHRATAALVSLAAFGLGVVTIPSAKCKLSASKRILFLCVIYVAAAIRSPGQTLTTLVNFNITNGAIPWAGLVQGLDGNFYGTTLNGGTSTNCGFGAEGCGTVFKMTPGGTLTTLYSFDGTHGTGPQAGLVQGTDGNFYGTTTFDGANGFGTIFQITPEGTLTTLHSFNVADGAYPTGALVQATDGNFYGTTAGGGANSSCEISIYGPGCGTVFMITPEGTLTTLHSFNVADGDAPTAGVVQGSDGNLYGTTSVGGNFNCAGGRGCGTVFGIIAGGTLTTLYSFCAQTGCPDGWAPGGGLVEATAGHFYGTTAGGGANSDGTVFEITSGGTLTTLHSFDATDGASPIAAVVKATDGSFYGTTSAGGTKDYGTVFKITPGGTLTTLYSFCSKTNCTDGANPFGGLTQATDGSFYGTTLDGGTDDSCTAMSLGCGTVFKLSVQTSPAPTIVSISPTSAIAGGAAFTLTVNGTNFVSGSTINFNGNARTTTFVSATQLTATILASDIAIAASFNVTVTNPSGGGTSNAVNFMVLTPQQATGTIINAVNALFSQGVINGGQDNSLVVQLQHAISLMNAGKNAGAIGNLESFISEVNDLLRSGVLSASQAASLVSAAVSVIMALS